MPNISLTRRCTRNCPYCFARDERGGGAGRDPDMPDGVFADVLSLSERSGLEEVRLLGGEPTLHPGFKGYVGQALERGFRVVIFTGGAVPEDVMRFLATTPPASVRILLNTAFPGTDSDTLVQRQRALCEALGERVMLGVNLHAPGKELSFLLEWIAQYKLVRCVRLGLAHPIWDGTNRFLRPQQYRRAGEEAAGFAEAARAAGVALDFDCGWTPCMFPDGFWDEYGGPHGDIGLRCNPIVDILPEGDAIYCYAMSRAPRQPIRPGDTRDDLVRRFEAQMAGYRPLGIFPECGECAYRRAGQCAGGCLATAMNRIRRCGINTREGGGA